jgi:hypothetical protein
MPATLKDTLLSVWRQVMIDDSPTVNLEDKKFRVRKTSRSRLREVDFQFEGRELRALEQNPKTTSRWAKLAREGKKVMQFLEQGQYIAVIADSKVQIYGKK